MSTGRLRVTCKSTILGPTPAGRRPDRPEGERTFVGRKARPETAARVCRTIRGSTLLSMGGMVRTRWSEHAGSENGRGCAGFFGGHPKRCRTQPIPRTTLASTADRGEEVRPQPARLGVDARGPADAHHGTRLLGRAEVGVGRDGEARGPDDPSLGRPGRVRRKHHARSDRVLRERRTLYRDPGGRRPQRRRLLSSHRVGRRRPASHAHNIGLLRTQDLRARAAADKRRDVASGHNSNVASGHTP